jgi:hypothetical protein
VSTIGVSGSIPKEGRQTPSLLRKPILSCSSSFRDGKNPQCIAVDTLAVFPTSKIEYQLNLHFLVTGRFCQPSLKASRIWRLATSSMPTSSISVTWNHELTTLPDRFDCLTSVTFILSHIGRSLCVCFTGLCAIRSHLAVLGKRSKTLPAVKADLGGRFPKSLPLKTGLGSCLCGLDRFFEATCHARIFFRHSGMPARQSVLSGARKRFLTCFRDCNPSVSRPTFVCDGLLCCSAKPVQERDPSLTVREARFPS